MDLLQLQYFRTIARLEHITKAAEELHIAQPSLSRTISKLEEELGTPLFDRVGRQIKLNSFGKSFLSHVDKIFSELIEAKRELLDLSDIKNCKISLAVNTSIFMPALLKKFVDQYPYIKFQQTLATTSNIRNLLESEQVDFGISVTPISSSKHPSIQEVPIINVEAFLALPPKHALLECNSISLHDIENEPFISMPKGYGLREIADDFCYQAGFNPNIIIESNEPLSIIRYVKYGLGLAFITPLILEIDPNLEINLIRIQDVACKGTINLCWKKDRYISKAAHQFMKFVINYFHNLEKDTSKNIYLK
ncbi:LysR family transcriptional regulator [Clostridium hydrogenum]|uniref:LysR family transcriptional regulator n=1 Tax=Clostridium hydrogenum TaxID=2855764 RepID=UPI001F44A13E|nr:LysR family transcriptional regulator [Clostridium hydrogenum]